MTETKKKSTKCTCSPQCQARVFTRGRKYAHGHSPAFWGRNRISDAANTMTAQEFAEYRAKLKTEHGPYAIEKKLNACPRGCGYVDGVRGLQRHRATCPKRTGA